MHNSVYKRSTDAYQVYAKYNKLDAKLVNFVSAIFEHHYFKENKIVLYWENLNINGKLSGVWNPVFV